MRSDVAARTVDLAEVSTRALNALLHASPQTARWRVLNPRGAHAVAVGVDADATIEIDGDVGYYCAGMNKRARVIVAGAAGVGLAENMMSGFVRVMGAASDAAGASARGGVIVVEGDAAARCAISLKGADVIVKGSVGPMSAFMAQAGALVIFGDAGDALGDSIYEAQIFVRGAVRSLGADCVEEPMQEADRAGLYARLESAGAAGEIDVADFRRYGSARTLYHFHVDNAGAY